MKLDIGYEIEKQYMKSDKAEKSIAKKTELKLYKIYDKKRWSEIYEIVYEIKKAEIYEIVYEIESRDLWKCIWNRKAVHEKLKSCRKGLQRKLS